MAAGVLGVVLAACDGNDPGTAEPDTAEPGAADETAGGDEDGASQAGDTAGDEEVTTTETDLGTFLVDGQGMTLYLFTEDSPGMSACTDECLENWPILPGEPEAGAGVEADLLGSIERDDGDVQATYADWPLYYFVQDAEPGDVTGQGVQDVWYVLAPDGQMITEEAESSRPGY